MTGGAGQALRVMLVEDHAMVRSAIRQTLSVPGIEVVAEAGSAEEALEVVMQHRPDVLLVDIDLPGMSGIHLVRELAPRLPHTRIVMLTGSGRRDDLIAAIRNGAVGYLTKDTSSAGLVRSILGIRDGDLPMPRRLANELIKEVAAFGRGDTRKGGLTDREVEVIELVDRGLTDRQIAEALGISPRTVGRHVGSILAKFGARNRAEATRRFREGD